MISLWLFCSCSQELSLADMASQESFEEVKMGSAPLRRLTHAQYNNILRSVFGEEIVVPTLAEPDMMSAGYLAVGASKAAFTNRGIESIESAAFGLAKQVIESSDSLGMVLSCTPTGADDATCAQTFISELGSKLWRKEISTEEVSRYRDIVLEAAAVYDDFNKGLEFGIAALLQSPYFLYRMELGTPSAENPGQREFTGRELATKLSLFLWNDIPDEELLASVADGSIDTREGLFVQAKRMLEDPKAKEGVSEFFVEYLRLHKLKDMTKDPSLFEHYYGELGSDAREETLRFLEYLVFEAQADFRESLTSHESFVNNRLASIYAIPYTGEGDFQYIEHPADVHRPGLLAHVSFLALHGHSVSTSATIRGASVRSVLLCQEIAPAPVGVDTSIPEATGTTQTLRERVAEHLEDPSCASCHMLMDPIGLGLENYDSIGRWRTHDNGALIDPSGDLDGAPFVNPTELAQAIVEKDNFSWCLTRGLVRYANGREEIRSERDYLDILNERMKHHEYRVQPLLLEIVMSPMFVRSGMQSEEE